MLSTTELTSHTPRTGRWEWVFVHTAWTKDLECAPRTLLRSAEVPVTEEEGVVSTPDALEETDCPLRSRGRVGSEW